MRKLLLLVICCTAALHSAVAQQHRYEIYTTTSSTYSDQHGKPTSVKTWASGVYKNTITNIVLTHSPDNKLVALEINNVNIAPEDFMQYEDLVVQTIEYVERGQSVVEPNSVTVVPMDNPPVDEQLSDDDRRKIMDLVKKELIADKLIDNPNVFEFLLTGDKLFINGKVKEQPIFEKYKAIYERYYGPTLSKATYFQISQTL